MPEMNGEFPTVIGPDARFKGELSFDKGVRIEGGFDGHIKSKGTLHVAEGSRVTANIEAANVRLEGECKGNFVVSEKLHLLATAKVEGDLRANRLEIADGAIFIGNVVVGQAAAEAPMRRPVMQESAATPQVHESPRPVSRPAPAPAPSPRPAEVRVPG
jgi:cytoskeletal protein CcmA (bactofilin family)